MARAHRTRLAVFLVTIAAVIGLVAVVFVGLAPPDGITVTTQGAPVVGADFRFFVTVRERHLPSASGTYLSLGGLNGTFEIPAGSGQGHPWGRANVWNLTGLDASYGLSFTLDVTPSWAAEIPLEAAVWTNPGGFGSVRFMNGDVVDPATVSVLDRSRTTVVTAWPLTAFATPDGTMAVGQPTTVRVKVRGSGGPLPTAGPLFLSVATKSMYYTIKGNGSSDNPWNVTALWNITGADLTQGIETSFTATPMMAAKGLGLDLVVWSPRGSLDEVQLAYDGSIITPAAVRLWVDTTFNFSVTSP